jgi:hypothetical protein
MIITAATVIEVLPMLISLFQKICTTITTGDPQNISDEIKALEAARLKSSQAIIDEADEVSKGD